jgi:arsenate reductase
MAEALAREILPKHIQCWSAGIAAHGMNPHVATVMQEIGLNIDSQYSKIIEDLPDIKFDYVITVCNNASEQCPTFPATKILHHSFSDPPKLALAYNTEEEKIDCYRKVRDEIQSWLSLQDLNC